MSSKHKLEHVSASQIKTFKDCPRKWYYQKILGIPTPSTASTDLGKQVHSIIEAYFKDLTEIPKSLIGEIANKGLPFLPAPSKSIEIEVGIHESMPIKNTPVPIMGFIDMLERGDGFIRIIDHKTTGSKRYMKTALELKFDAQMVIYAQSVFDNFFIDEIELVHIYYGTKEPYWADKISVKIERKECLQVFESILDTIKEMKESSTKEIEDIPRNTESCFKFGGCPFLDTCISMKAMKTITLNKDNENNMSFTNKLGLKPVQPEQPMQPMQPMQPAQPMQPIQPVQPAQSMNILYVGAFPQKGTKAPVTFYEAFANEINIVCQKFQVLHLSQVDYGKGWVAFQSLILETGWPTKASSIFLDPMSEEYNKIGSVLITMADVVIRRA